MTDPREGDGSDPPVEADDLPPDPDGMVLRPTVAIPTKFGEPARRILMDAGVLDGRLQIGREDDLLLFPLAEGAGPEEVLTSLSRMDIGDEPLRISIMKHHFAPRGMRVGHFRDLLDLPPGMLELVPRAFDVAGDIAVLKLDEALRPHWSAIGKALLKAHSNIRLAAADRGVAGEFRVRELEAIAGEGGFATEHREGGMLLSVDLSKAYFSPRLAHERERVAGLARDAGDRSLLDMFAGVGPFAVAVARAAEDAEVIAVDLNPAAVELMAVNIGRNGVAGRVTPVCGDAGEETARLTIERGGPFADRVIMNHPHGAFPFLRAAVGACRAGGTIHYHEIMDRDVEKERRAELEGEASSAGRSAGCAGVRRVRTYSASMDHLCFDLVVE